MKAKVVSFTGPTDAAVLSLLTINLSYSEGPRTTQLIVAVPQFSVNRNIAQTTFSYQTRKRVLSMDLQKQKNNQTGENHSLSNPTSSFNSDQDQMLQKCQKICIRVDFLLYLFLGAVFSAPVKPVVQPLSLSLSIQNLKSERSVP